MENKTPIIRMDGLGKAFTGSQGTVRALEDISLEIMPGEIFGIIGLSGAGKSTLVRCMNYLEVPTEGEVYYDGKSLSEMQDAELRKVRQSMGMIFQQFNLLAQRNILKNVCFPMEISGVPAAQAKKRALELLALDSRESFLKNKQYYQRRLEEEPSPALRELLRQDMEHLDARQSSTAASREFVLVCRLDSKAAEDRELPRRLEKQIQDHGFHVCLAGEQDVKRILAVYYQQDVVTEHFEQVDGERWVTEHG